MRKDTNASVNKKIDQMTDNNHYQWYQFFHNAGKTNRAEIALYYIDSIAKKFGQVDKLKSVFEEIYEGQSLILEENDYRESDEFKLSLRGKHCDNETIVKETYIQRNLFKNSNLYVDKLGHIFGYEVTFVRKKRCMPVDLISYKLDGERLCINLIELKACRAETIKSPAADLLLRALFEVVTYKAYFQKVLAKNDKLAQVIQDVLKADNVNKSIQEIKDADIKLIIIAPDYIINEKENLYMREFLKSQIQLFTITPAGKFDDATTVGKEERLFLIE